MSAPVKVTIDEAIVLDASLSERHSSNVEVTVHPIEDGADPTDHARQLPDSLQLEGLFSNTPLDPAEARTRGNTAAGASGYAQDQDKRMLDLLSSRRPVTVRTERKTYRNMILVSYEVPRDAKIGDAVKFSATFKEVRFVKSEIVRLELVTRPNTVPEKPIKKAEKGKQPTEEKPEVTRSLAKKFTDWTGITEPGSGL